MSSDQSKESSSEKTSGPSDDIPKAAHAASATPENKSPRESNVSVIILWHESYTGPVIAAGRPRSRSLVREQSQNPPKCRGDEGRGIESKTRASIQCFRGRRSLLTDSQLKEKFKENEGFKNLYRAIVKTIFTVPDTPFPKNLKAAAHARGGAEAVAEEEAKYYARQQEAKE